MRTQNPASIQLTILIITILLLPSCNSTNSSPPTIPPPDWIKFTESSPPSFSIWLSKDWEMESTRDSESVAPTAFVPINNPGEAYISVTFKFDDTKFYEYTLEFQQFKAFCSRTEFTLRITHECSTGPYPASQYFLNQEQDKQVYVSIIFNILLEKENAYKDIWVDAVKSFIYEQPPTLP